MSFSRYITEEREMWESTKTLKEVTRDRLGLVKALKKYKSMVVQSDKRDYSRAIELIKPQNILYNLSESEINEAVPKSYALLANALTKSLDDLLSVSIKNTDEKQLKIDFDNMAEAVSIIFTVGFDNLTESLTEGRKDFAVSVQKRAIENGISKSEIATAISSGVGLTPCMKSKFFGGKKFVRCDGLQLKVLSKFYDEANLSPGNDLFMYDEIVTKLKKNKPSLNPGEYVLDKYRFNPNTNKFITKEEYISIAKARRVAKETALKARMNDPLFGAEEPVTPYLQNIAFMVGSNTLVFGLLAGFLGGMEAGLSAAVVMGGISFIYSLFGGGRKSSPQHSKWMKVNGISESSNKAILKVRKRLEVDFKKLYKKRKFMK